jgi:hypothetical protein
LNVATLAETRGKRRISYFRDFQGFQGFLWDFRDFAWILNPFFQEKNGGFQGLENPEKNL